ncbi:MAG: MerR family transcriptional regulator [Candidatus Marinimicrobia bacterium]|nr:MerR family transcriptional regulator [Candidatus Neomarinimicrobiota bacterium]
MKKLYYSISEVSEITGLKPYVLRYWETEFKQLAPPKNRAGNRTYRQKDIELIQQLKQLLHVEKFTIEGARKKLTEKPEKIETATEEEQPILSEAVADENSTEENKRRKKMLSYIRQELESMLEVLQR